MNFCVNCGNKLNSNKDYCSNCGTYINNNKIQVNDINEDNKKKLQKSKKMP